MKTDVQTLIAALITERDSLDRAIVALRQIRTGEPPAERVAVKANGKAHTKRIRSVRRIDEATRARAIEGMSLAKTQGANLRKAARALGRELGIKPATIVSGWQRWNGAKTEAAALPDTSAVA